MTFTYSPKPQSLNLSIDDIPGDKSISHRAVIIGSLANNMTSFTNFLCAQDCLNTATIFKQLGVPITIDTTHQSVTIKGVGLQGLTAPKTPLDVGNSGTGIRLITGVLAGQPFNATLTGDHSILKRPMKRIIRPLSAMGAKITGTPIEGKTDHYPPLSIEGHPPLSAIDYELPVASAQVKSAILFASLFAQGTTKITEPAPCRNHTEVMLSSFGANIDINKATIMCNGQNPLQNPFSSPITIPSDFSSASFFIVLGLISENTTITLKHIGLNPTRSRLLDVLKQMGAQIHIENIEEGIEPYGDITVTSSTLTNIAIDPNDIPYIIDEIPILAVAALFGKGKLIVTNAEELRVKESDRIHSIVELINAFGGTIEEFDDGFILHAGLSPHKPKINTYYDHRIAMSAIIAATALQIDIELDSIEAIQTSFPNFLDILN